MEHPGLHGVDRAADDPGDLGARQIVEVGELEDGAHVQELINAVELSFRERRWVSIPLDGDRPA